MPIGFARPDVAVDSVPPGHPTVMGPMIAIVCDAGARAPRGEKVMRVSIGCLVGSLARRPRAAPFVPDMRVAATRGTRGTAQPVDAVTVRGAALRTCRGAGAPLRGYALRMFHGDTTASALRAQLEALRRLGTVGRMSLGAQMCDDARQITLDGIRRRHPEFSGEQVKHEFFRVVLGEELAARVRSAKP